MKLGNFFYMSGMKVLDYLIKWDYISIKEGGKSDISTHLPTLERKNVTKHELIKLLDSTFHDVEFDIFEDIEGLLRVNFVIDEEEDDE